MGNLSFVIPYLIRDPAFVTHFIQYKTSPDKFTESSIKIKFFFTASFVQPESLQIMMDVPTVIRPNHHNKQRLYEAVLTAGEQRVFCVEVFRTPPKSHDSKACAKSCFGSVRIGHKRI